MQRVTSPCGKCATGSIARGCSSYKRTPITTQARVCVNATDFVRQDGFEAATEVAEAVAALVHLHALAVVLDLRVHAVGALLHGVFDGFARFRLGRKKKQKKNHAKVAQISLFRWSGSKFKKICSWKFFLKKRLQKESKISR